MLAYLVFFACVVAASALQLSAPWVMKYAIDDLVAGVTAEKVRNYAAILLSLAAVGGYFRFLVRRTIVGASREFEYSLRNEFFARLQVLDLGYFQRTRTGDLMSRATSDLNAVRMMMGQQGSAEDAARIREELGLNDPLYVQFVRYLGHVAVFRATVPQTTPAGKLAFPQPANFIDEHVFAKLKQLGLPPSELCSDSEFLRRVGIAE